MRAYTQARIIPPTQRDNPPFTIAVKKHRKWLKFLAGKEMKITYTQSNSQTGETLLAAWLWQEGKPTKRLICKNDAEDLWSRHAR